MTTQSDKALMIKLLGDEEAIQDLLETLCRSTIAFEADGVSSPVRSYAATLGSGLRPVVEQALVGASSGW